MGIIHYSIFNHSVGRTGSVGGRFVNRPYDYALKKPSIERPFAVPGALLAEVAAASLTDRGTHCALAVSATGSARARDRGEIFSQDEQKRTP